MNCLGGQMPINLVRVTIKPLPLLFIRTCALLIVAPDCYHIFILPWFKLFFIISSYLYGFKLPWRTSSASCIDVIVLSKSMCDIFYFYIVRLLTLIHIIIIINNHRQNRYPCLHHHQNVIISLQCSPLALQLAANYGVD